MRMLRRPAVEVRLATYWAHRPFVRSSRLLIRLVVRHLLVRLVVGVEAQLLYAPSEVRHLLLCLVFPIDLPYIMKRRAPEMCFLQYGAFSSSLRTRLPEDGA